MSAQPQLPRARGLLPHHVHGSGPHLRVAAHDGHAGGERAVNAKHDELCSSRHDGQIAVGGCVVPPVRSAGENIFNLISCDVITPLICK